MAQMPSLPVPGLSANRRRHGRQVDGKDLCRHTTSAVHPVKHICPWVSKLQLIITAFTCFTAVCIAAEILRIQA